MKVLVLVIALAAVALADPVIISELSSLGQLPTIVDGVAPDAEQPSILGYLVNVAVPQAEARRKAEEAYFAQAERIAGGTPAGLGEIPWQAGLVTDIVGVTGYGVCGASLVSNDRLVTAAHCWFDGVNTAWRFTVVLGSIFLFFEDGTRVQTSRVVMHPNWEPERIRNDVAVIYLDNPVAFSNTISPISLPSGTEITENFAGSSAIASGFGLTGDSGSDATITNDQFLSSVNVPVITNLLCFWTYRFAVTASNICISGAGGRSTCSGDSGGPLVVTRNNRPVLIGIASFGSVFGCETGRPAAFARVTSFLDFFNQHVSKPITSLSPISSASLYIVLFFSFLSIL